MWSWAYCSQTKNMIKPFADQTWRADQGQAGGLWKRTGIFWAQLLVQQRSHIHMDNTQGCGCNCYSRPPQSSSPSSWGMAAQPFKGWPALRSRTGNLGEIWHQNKQFPSCREPGLKQTLLSVFSTHFPVCSCSHGGCASTDRGSSNCKNHTDLFRGKGSK